MHVHRRTFNRALDWGPFCVGAPKGVHAHVLRLVLGEGQSSVHRYLAMYDCQVQAVFRHVRALQPQHIPLRVQS